LMDFLEAIYLKYGKTKIALGASLMLNRTWNMSRDSLTQNYFKWDQLLSVK
jgi:DNA polymerase V